MRPISSYKVSSELSCEPFLILNSSLIDPFLSALQRVQEDLRAEFVVKSNFASRFLRAKHGDGVLKSCKEQLDEELRLFQVNRALVIFSVIYGLLFQFILAIDSQVALREVNEHVKDDAKAFKEYTGELKGRMERLDALVRLSTLRIRSCSLTYFADEGVSHRCFSLNPVDVSSCRSVLDS